MMPLDSTGGTFSRNVLGGKLETCSLQPLTGFTRTATGFLLGLHKASAFHNGSRFGCDSRQDLVTDRGNFSRGARV